MDIALHIEKTIPRAELIELVKGWLGEQEQAQLFSEEVCEDDMDWLEQANYMLPNAWVEIGYWRNGFSVAMAVSTHSDPKLARRMGETYDILLSVIVERYDTRVFIETTELEGILYETNGRKRRVRFDFGYKGEGLLLRE